MVSDDNPFIESFFKKLKYKASYPQYFNSIEHTRKWFVDFIDWYNNRHWHSGMQYITPMQKRKDMHCKIFASKNETLSNAKERFPNRWGKRNTRKFIVKKQEILNPEVKKLAWFLKNLATSILTQRGTCNNIVVIIIPMMHHLVFRLCCLLKNMIIHSNLLDFETELIFSLHSKTTESQIDS